MMSGKGVLDTFIWALFGEKGRRRNGRTRAHVGARGCQRGERSGLEGCSVARRRAGGVVGFACALHVGAFAERVGVVHGWVRGKARLLHFTPVFVFRPIMPITVCNTSRGWTL